MKKVIVTYKVKADRAEENEMLIKQVFKQLLREMPEGIQYAVYKLSDGVSFVHVASFEDAEANDTFTGLPAFRDFREAIKDRCEVQPVTTHVQELGWYY